MTIFWGEDITDKDIFLENFMARIFLGRPFVKDL